MGSRALKALLALDSSDARNGVGARSMRYPGPSTEPQKSQQSNPPNLTSVLDV